MQAIASTNGCIVIPSPVLSEIIVKVPDKTDALLKQIKTSPWLRVEGFDSAAAVELGIRTSRAIAAGDKREGLQCDWTKIKFDRQIIAIAIVANADVVISDDGDIAAIGERWGVKVQGIDELPLPAELIPPPLLRKLEDDNEIEIEAEKSEALVESVDAESQSNRD
jgi:predicted nucleic acid-binding protein